MRTRGGTQKQIRKLLIFYAFSCPFREPKRLVFRALPGVHMLSCGVCHVIELNGNQISTGPKGPQQSHMLSSVWCWLCGITKELRPWDRGLSGLS